MFLRIAVEDVFMKMASLKTTLLIFLLFPDFSTHHLRHTFCTRFCENENNLKVIQAVMGHKDIQITMDIYADCTEDKKKEVIQKIEGKIFVM